MPWTGKLTPLYWVHGTVAIIFFLAIASVAAFCSHATVGLINNPAQRQLYMGAYRFLAVLMIASPIAGLSRKVCSYRGSGFPSASLRGKNCGETNDAEA